MRIDDPDPELLQSKEVREDPGIETYEKVLC